MEYDLDKMIPLVTYGIKDIPPQVISLWRSLYDTEPEFLDRLSALQHEIREKLCVQDTPMVLS